MRSLRNISWLAGKELRTLWRDLLLLLLVFYSFGPGMYVESIAAGETISKTAVAFVDEDNSALSRSLQTALYPPWFLPPRTIEASQIDPMMDWGEVIFAVVVPRGFEMDIRSGRPVALQINIDATKTQQAAIGTGYLTAILTQEVQRFAAQQDLVSVPAVELVVRRSFNPSGNNVWFAAIGGLLNSLSMLTIVLVGAALIREREHGTIEHLLLMPVTAIEIALAKIVANGGVILIAFTFSLFIIVEGALGIPFAGSQTLLLMGTAIYIFAAGAIGLLLGTLARTMAQFALLIMLVIMPMMILSGGMTPVESQPAWLQPITWLLPSRHYMSFAEAIFYRGAGLDLIWTEFLWTFVLGAATLMLSLIIFRRSVTGG
ncbi:ABC transporter permease [Chelativorans sp. Marseille-P2723]|uniref:ABC transporter permease n=1 Tax=Chelativorans sp. Marseille-P2723 TaxID=2709133 RepID=UPI001570DE3C|nr:ABC transporter permease [Chelativorans sp. Marseille-P2723]